MKGFNWILLPLLLLLQGIVASTSAKYINTPCTAVSDCGIDNHLQCINGYCQCDNLHEIYDQSTSQCLLLVGRQCQISSQSPPNTNPNPKKCVPHSDCTKSMCRCKPGYRLSFDFLCKPDYGSPCNGKDGCDETQGLACYQGICQCFNSTWSYEGQFGCVDHKNPSFDEMLGLLNETQNLLRENKLEIKDMFNDLGLQNDPNTEFIMANGLAEARQFQDTYNTNDLQFAAQNQNSQSSGSGLNLGQLFSLFQNVQSLFGRNNNNNGGSGGGGGGGFFRNLFGRGNQQGGYPEAMKPPEMAGYGPPGQPEGMQMQGQRFRLILPLVVPEHGGIQTPLTSAFEWCSSGNFLNLFNRMIPVVRQLRTRFSGFFQNFLNRFAPTTTAAPAPAAIHNPPPTVIQSSGNYQQNPIFDNNQQQPTDPNGANQGEGTFRFIMRTRMRFRNALRGNQGGGGGGGYDYTPANPATGYGTPDAAAPPPESGAPPPAAEGDSPPPAASQQNYYTNQAPQRNIYAGQQVQNQQQHATNVNYNNIPASAAHQHQPHVATPQRQQSFGSLPSPSTFNSGHNLNPTSFFNQPTQLSSQANLNNQQHRQISQQLYHQHKNQNQQLQSNNNFNNNNNHLQPNNNFNAQATSHHQNTFVPHPQPNQQHHIQQQPSQNTYATINTNTNRPPLALAPIVASSPPPPPPIPQFKLQVQSQTLPQESLKQNFILTEEDDPHPGFTPHSTAATPEYQESFRNSARFERIGHEEPSSTVETSAAENWRDSF